MMFYRNFIAENCWGPAFWSPWNFIWIFAVIALIAVVLVVVIRKGKRPSAYSALNELKMKYVNGEISEEEYLKRKTVLSNE